MFWADNTAAQGTDRRNSIRRFFVSTVQFFYLDQLVNSNWIKFHLVTSILVLSRGMIFLFAYLSSTGPAPSVTLLSAEIGNSKRLPVAGSQWPASQSVGHFHPEMSTGIEF